MGQAMQAVVEFRRAKMEISVQDVLEWAFGPECASIDFNEFGAPLGVDTIWLLMQRGLLGCKIDGGRMGGGAQSADDADIIAGVVASLPVSHGGRSMAVKIAELARACATPEFYPDASPRVVPLEWRSNQHGNHSMTMDARDMFFSGHGRFAAKDVRACPVRIVPTAQQIGAARRFYLDWIGALMHIQHQLQLVGLSRWEITPDLPPLSPWNKGD